MMRNIARLAMCCLLVGCIDEGLDNAPSNNPEWYGDNNGPSEPVVNPFAGGPECGFDSARQGKEVGDHIGNLGLPDQYLHKKWLHKQCGTDTKALWIIAAAAW
jgi:hypothetical protein